jgi:hypothetical protein
MICANKKAMMLKMSNDQLKPYMNISMMKYTPVAKRNMAKTALKSFM